ncbi:cytochrome P450 82A4-like [Vicia villosa]|uniref:cytochrome P450 82A4-like n=1 Tax=Vicia villosa TaxID=3911 RepID=UPI00273C5FE3|nr:cytochrome P450 82A4-like [Vicia villosa]
MLVPITVAFFSIFFFYYLSYRNSKVSNTNEVPIVQGAWPIIGHLPLLRASKGIPHKTLGHLATKYGPLFSIKLGSKRALVLSNWEMAKECFTKIDLAVSSRPMLESTQHMAYNGAMFTLAPYGPFWRQARKITTLEILSHRRLEQLQHFRVMEVRRSIKDLYNDSDHQDFMDVMLSLLDGKTVEGYDSDTTIKGTMLALIAGGVDTTCVTLTLLLKNPHVMKKAKEELNIQVGKERRVEVSDIENLVYLQSIVKETLRLYPPVPLSVPREFSEDCNLGGYDVEKGTRLILNLWKIHTDPKIWLDPLEFKPERFRSTHKEIDVKGHNFELLPFGSGRRVCPGISLGLEMVSLTLASFLHSFEISSPSCDSIDMSEAFGVTNTKATPLEILIKPCLSVSYYENM